MTRFMWSLESRHLHNRTGLRFEKQQVIRRVSEPLTTEWMCNIEYLSETHLKLTSRQHSLAYNLALSNPIVLKVCADHGSNTVVLCAKVQNEWTTVTDVMDEPKYHFPIIYFTVIQYRFDILHRARQYHWRTLCKISKRLCIRKWCYGRTRFCEMWV